jgi:8-oxo-dGTP pyrophosphatase MutT (NUDIX family)
MVAAPPESSSANRGLCPLMAPVMSLGEERMRTNRRNNGEAVRWAKPSLGGEPQPWISAGGVVFRRSGHGELEVALVGRRRPVRWALPKGTRRPNESLERTAVREVEEETGLQVRLLRPIGTIRYTFELARIRYAKTVDFYLMQAIGGDTAWHDHEYEFARWFPAGEALRQIAYPNEAFLVEQALGIVELNSGVEFQALGEG